MQNMSDESQTPPQSTQQQGAQPEKPPRLPRKVILPAMLILIKAMAQQYYQPPSAVEQEKLIASLHKVGVTDTFIPGITLVTNSVGKGLRDQDIIPRLDRNLVGVCAALDLVLFPIITSILATPSSASTPTTAIHIALIALVVALPCTAWSLSLGFLLKKPRNYGPPHSTFSAVAIWGTIISVAALIWSLWNLAGILFIAATAFTFLSMLIYVGIILYRKYFSEIFEKLSRNP